MNNFQFKIFNFQIVVMFCLLFIPLSLSAATFVVEVDTGTETVNALEGKLVLPQGAAGGEVYTGHSAILIWINQPAWKTGQNVIPFSGLTPGGFRGKYPVFSISGIDLEDVGQASFSDVAAYRNDGSGTEANVILRLIPGMIEEDLVPPEPFKPLISSSAELFDSVRFISFIAQDKDTGIERYDYASSWLFSPGERDWHEALSPLPLSRTMLFQKTYIRAIDHAGNFRIVSTAGPYHYYLLIFGVIMLLCVLSFLKRSFHSRSQ